MGAGLLAKRACQATLMLSGTPPSRASPLPQVLDNLRIFNKLQSAPKRALPQGSARFRSAWRRFCGQSVCT
ncbi:hypothetical protein C1884_24595 [Pseudomonas sp. GW460-R15]|nr:hypothetical protein C1887_17780 [Pseudomonas sp. GW456-R21]POA63297.1 hypothetical protein C1884_24595 [Pseudomonas sp. GW460-R15]